MDSGGESDSSVTSDPGDMPPATSPELSEISKMLLKAKAAAEVGLCDVVSMSD